MPDHVLLTGGPALGDAPGQRGELVACRRLHPTKPHCAVRVLDICTSRNSKAQGQESGRLRGPLFLAGGVCDVFERLPNYLLARAATASTSKATASRD
jgi:hypothetical protein